MKPIIGVATYVGLYRFYVELLNNNGYVVFQIDHYKARKIKYDKTFSKVSGLTFMNDAYAALDILKTNEKTKRPTPVINN